MCCFDEGGTFCVLSATSQLSISPFLAKTYKKVNKLMPKCSETGLSASPELSRRIPQITFYDKKNVFFGILPFGSRLSFCECCDRSAVAATTSPIRYARGRLNRFIGTGFMWRWKSSSLCCFRWQKLCTIYCYCRLWLFKRRLKSDRSNDSFRMSMTRELSAISISFKSITLLSESK